MNPAPPRSDGTAIASPPLCPEIRLHLAADFEATWERIEHHAGRAGLPPPFWSIAWPGGQSLARHLLDQPSSVRGLRVLDFGSGSGLCAIAAARAGAGFVEAADIDPRACDAIAANAALNGVRVTALRKDLLGEESRWDVVLAADLWYERFLAQRVTSWLRVLAGAGTRVLVGDLGRAFFPLLREAPIAEYEIACSPSVEPGSVAHPRVWDMGP